MNVTERRLAGRMYACLSAMTGLRPTNAADIAAISKNLRLSTDVSGRLMCALEHIGYREYEEAEGYLGDAERLLDVTPKVRAADVRR